MLPDRSLLIHNLAHWLRALYLGIAASMISAVTPALAEDTTGLQSRLAQRGVYIGIQYLGEVFTVVDGGVETGTKYLHLVNTPLTFDLEQLAGIHNASIYINSQWATGGSPTELAGDLQVISNSDAPNTWKLFEAFYRQTFFEQRLDVLAGLYDLNSEFDVIEHAGVFINSSFGIGPDFSQSGENGPSVFPTTSLALRIATRLHDDITIRASILDGVPGDPDDPYGTKIILDEDDGLLLAGEVELTPELTPGFRAAIGGWHYTEESQSLVDDIRSVGSPDFLHNRGAYVIGETTLWHDPVSDRAVGAFARYGVADDRVNQIGDYFGFGIVTTSLLSGEFDHTVGLGVAIARNSEEVLDAFADNGVVLEKAETAIELTGSFQVHERMAVQPDIQYIINPGTDPALDNALALGLRVDVSF